MVFKPVVCLNDEPAEDDKAGEIEQCGPILGELKSALG
jgi:hypothetical protein